MRPHRPLHARLLTPARACVGACAVLMCAVAAAPSDAATATLYVDQKDPACSASGPGTSTTPFCTISAAALKTTAGTTVVVSSGTYTEQVSARSGASGAPVVFTTAPGASVTVTGGTYGFYVSNKSWVTVQGFNVTNTIDDGIHVSSGSHDIKLIGNHVSFAGKPAVGQTGKGIYVSNVTDSVLQGNTVDHVTNYGIYLDSSTRNQVLGNTSAFNAKVFAREASGIRLYNSPSNTVASNVSHDNEDSGLEFYTGSNNNLVIGNVSYDNGDHGIDNFSSTGQDIVGNTVYKSLTAGINVEGASTGATLANNISVDSGTNSSPRTKGQIRVDAQSVTGTTIDYDLVDTAAANPMFDWSGTLYGSVAALRSATGQEQHGLQGDPKWVSKARGDLHLTPDSPAIDSADSAAPGQPATDTDGKARFDEPSTPNTGAGPRTYDDRGAYELQKIDNPPNAQLAVTPASGTAPLEVSADASASTDADDTPIATYRFDFGDGTGIGPQAAAAAGHTYAAAGTYTVKVTVTDTAGLSSTATTQVTVNAPPDAAPAAQLAVTPASGPAPLAVTADASGSSDTDSTPIASYRFDFGDGTVVGPQAAASATHQYALPGTYTVTVRVTDTAGLSSTVSTPVSVTTADGGPVESAPTAGLSLSPTGGTSPLAVTADASGSTDADSTPIDTYTFDFGDGSPVVGPQAGSSATHAYSTAKTGTFTVTVTVTDTAGLSSTASTQITVTAVDQPPAATLAVTPASGLAPLDVTADASGSTDGDSTPIDAYTFDFGDGTPVVGPQAGSTAPHRYTAAGTYTAAVTVTDTAGKSSTATVQVTVSANLVRNSGFETDLTGWNTSGSGVGIALTRVSGGHSGGFTAKLANTGTTSSTCALNDSPNWVLSTTGGGYTATLWARADTAGATLRLRFKEWVGSALAGSAISTLTLSTTWQPVTLSYTAASPGSSTLDLNAYVTSAAPGTCFYADDVTIVH